MGFPTNPSSGGKEFFPLTGLESGKCLPTPPSNWTQAHTAPVPAGGCQELAGWFYQGASP